MPNREDVAREEEPSEAPDPAGGTAREATLALGTEDVRYRGYLDRVQNAVDLSWQWKEALLAAGVPGTVIVRFTLTPESGIEGVHVLQSSGKPILDREAVEAVRRAPLPSFPTHWTIERLHLVAQFDYRFE